MSDFLGRSVCPGKMIKVCAAKWLENFQEALHETRKLLKLPVFIDTLDGPVKLLSQCLGEEALDGDLELL